VRRLDGWEPREVTRYRYDRRGRLVESVTIREPEWDEQERGWMYALASYRQQVHEPCGTYLPDAIGEAAERAYRAELPVRCHVCTTRYAAIEAHLSGPHGAQPEALLFPVVRRR
jgi:hypothetical protein